MLTGYIEADRESVSITPILLNNGPSAYLLLDEFLLTENETLQNRVIELEKIIAKQQNEMVRSPACLTWAIKDASASHNSRCPDPSW